MESIIRASYVRAVTAYPCEVDGIVARLGCDEFTQAANEFDGFDRSLGGGFKEDLVSSNGDLSISIGCASQQLYPVTGTGDELEQVLEMGGGQRRQSSRR